MEVKLYSPRTKKVEEYTIIDKPVRRGEYCALITKTETIIGKFDFKDGVPLIGNQVIPKGMRVEKVLASSEKLEGCLHVRSLSQKELSSLSSEYAPKRMKSTLIPRVKVKNTLTPRAREVVIVLLIIVFIIAAFTVSPMSRSQAKSIVTNSEFVVFDENNTIYVEESKFKGDLKEALEVYETSMGYDVRVVVDEPLDI